MRVTNGVTIKYEGRSEPVALYNASSVSGESVIDDTRSIVLIDWKHAKTMLKMIFNSTKTEFVLQEMSLIRGGSNVELDVKTSHGYKVNAPRGFAWACDSTGMFEAKAITDGIKGVTLQNLRLFVSFPSHQLNVGPLWWCGKLMLISLCPSNK